MRNPLLVKFFLVFTIFFSVTIFAKEAELNSEEPKTDLKTEIDEYIQHHLKDSHDFSLFSYTGSDGAEHHIGFPLLIILWDDGLVVFSSSKFHHGEEVAASGNSHYKLYHGKIYKTDETGTINYDAEHHASNIKPLDFSITKSVMMILITGFLMLLLFGGLAKSYSKNGGIAKGVGRFFEPIILYIRDDIAIATIGEKKYKKYMPFLLTIFFFIWFLNMFGLTPLGVNVTGNIAITTALAILTFLITNLTGTKTYWKHLFGYNFAPRYARVSKVINELFDAKEDKDKRVQLNLKKPIKTKRITQHWDTIQRIAVSLNERKTTQATLVRKLSGYKKNHPLLEALSEYNRMRVLRASLQIVL